MRRVVTSLLSTLCLVSALWAQPIPPPTGGQANVVFLPDCSAVTSELRCCWDIDNFEFSCGTGTGRIILGAGTEVLDEGDNLIAGEFLRPAHPHTTIAGVPGVGTCLFVGEVIRNSLTGWLYGCTTVGGNPVLVDPGDALNTVSNGTNTCSATASTTIQFPSTATLTCPTVVNGVATTPLIAAIPESRLHFGFSCNDTATATEYLLSNSAAVASTCSATDTTAATNTRHMATSPMRLQNLYCFGLPEATDTWTFTVRSNGTNTAVTCNMTNPATTCNSAALTATTTAGAGISIEHVDSDAAFNGAEIRCGVEGVITP